MEATRQKRQRKAHLEREHRARYKELTWTQLEKNDNGRHGWKHLIYVPKEYKDISK